MADSCAFDTLFARNVPHILETIFLSINYKSFKECLEVSRTWKNLLTSDSIQLKAKEVFHKEIENECGELWHAAMQGMVLEAKKILSYAMVDVNCMLTSYRQSYMKSTPLYMAAFGGHKEVVKLLLHAGANPNMGTSLGRSPLHAAAESSRRRDVAKVRRSRDVAKVLLDGGAEPDRKDSRGDTPLHVAAVNGYQHLVKLLLERGADPTKEDEAGRNALALASRRGHKDTVKIITCHLLSIRGFRVQSLSAPTNMLVGFSLR